MAISFSKTSRKEIKDLVEYLIVNNTDTKERLDALNQLLNTTINDTAVYSLVFHAIQEKYIMDLETYRSIIDYYNELFKVPQEQEQETKQEFQRQTQPTQQYSYEPAPSRIRKKEELVEETTDIDDVVVHEPTKKQKEVKSKQQELTEEVEEREMSIEEEAEEQEKNKFKKKMHDDTEQSLIARLKLLSKRK